MPRLPNNNSCSVCDRDNCSGKLNELREFRDFSDLCDHVDEEKVMEWIHKLNHLLNMRRHAQRKVVAKQRELERLLEEKFGGEM